MAAGAHRIHNPFYRSRAGRLFLYSILCQFLASLPALSSTESSQTLSQTEAQLAAARIQSVGSDRSLEKSTTKAMQALVNFGSNNFTGAVREAYGAWGAFKTSEDLDRDRKKGILARVEMASIEAAKFTPEEVDFLASRTSYRRLDPKFLQEGESAKVANEFEKITGINRNDFLQMLGSVSENRLLVNHPDLPSEVTKKFDAFVENIPNDAFRNKVKKAMSLLPNQVREQLLVKALRSAPANRALASAADPSLSQGNQGASDKAFDSPMAENTSPHETLATPELQAFASQNFGFVPEEPSQGSDATGLGAVVKSALTLDLENETIFRRVHRKYQLIAPKLK